MNFRVLLVKFKPQLHLKEGCHPYPAVQEDGSVSGGLKWAGKQGGDCKGSKLGSQVYARSTWFGDVWAIMYAWYFPKGREAVSMHPYARFFGHCHNWEYAIVWIDNPALDDPAILGVSMSAATSYSKRAPPMAKYLDGDSLKVEYYSDAVVASTALRLTKTKGEFQDLVTWDQLPDAARSALIDTDWDTTLFNTGAKFPLKDSVFNETLAKACPL
ncbi:hypothetical protein BBJ29_007231 [Phytophthora kernoviae]|uniref:Necrosis inducing-like protein NPP1 type n=1 Tax=Phytophthora kernoviae TaxID=325452 RepID=A0A3F2RMG8_9STRA|nr:hypothetical protein BBJ29_007231 [Phytophthora kernoviae]RLN60431.1 hypothetical protein BBP00_00005994 [Phytophthora kernoviae]